MPRPKKMCRVKYSLWAGKWSGKIKPITYRKALAYLGKVELDKLRRKACSSGWASESKKSGWYSVLVEKK